MFTLKTWLHNTKMQKYKLSKNLIFSALDWKLLDLAKTVMLSISNDNILSGLEKKISVETGVQNVMLTNLGRIAIAVGLKSLGLRDGDGVILPTIICPTVIQTIIKSGFRPILADVENNLHLSVRTLEQCNYHKAKAVVAPHLYGLSAPIAEIEAWAFANKLYLVDDAAQTVGISVNGKPLGSFGDIGVFSFGPLKNLASSRGGALISNNAELIAKAKNFEIPSEKPLHIIRRLIACVIKFHLRHFFITHIQKFKANNQNKKQSQRISENTNNFLDQAFKPSTVETHLIYSVIKRKDAIFAKRRKTALKIAKILNNSKGFELVDSPAINIPYVKIPVRIFSDLTSKIAIQHFRKMGIEAVHIYRPLHLYPQYSQYSSGSLGISEDLWEKVFLIPNPVQSGNTELQKLYEAFHEPI